MIMVSLFKLSVKKTVKKILRIILALLSAFAVVVSILPYATAFADTSVPAFVIATNGFSYPQILINTNTGGFQIRSSSTSGRIRLTFRDSVSASYTFNVEQSSNSGLTFEFYNSNGSLVNTLVDPSSFTVDSVSDSSFVITNMSNRQPTILRSSYFNVATDITESYNSGYSAGYDVGYSSGVASVDTQSYYDQGYDQGYRLGYVDGLEQGVSDSPVASLGDYQVLTDYVASSQYSSGLTAGAFLDLRNLGTTLSAQELFDYVGSTNGMSGVYTFYRVNGDVGSPSVALVGHISASDYSVLRTSGFSISPGHKVVVSVTPVVFNWDGYGPSTTVYKGDTGYTANNSSYTFYMNRDSSGSLSRVRVWSGPDDNADYYDINSFYNSGSTYWFTFDITKLTSRLDFQFYTGTGFYLINIGYFSNDYNDSIAELIANGRSGTPFVVDRANQAIDDFNSSAGTINQWEDNMLSDFNTNAGSINSQASDFSFSSQFLTASTWVANQMQLGYTKSSDFRMFWIYPILFGIALVFIGGGIGHKRE